MTRVVLTDQSGGVAKEAVDLDALIRLGELAIPPCREAATSADAPLQALSEVEVALLADPEMAEVHVQFMNIPGSTDVITFHHGEILICVEEAERQAPLHGEPFAREIARYLVHGLLHLAGHEDHDPAEREEMHRIQEEILKVVWAEL